MSNRDKHFKGQQENETLICFFRHHWMVLAKDLFYFAIFAVAIVLSLLNFNSIVDIVRADYELKLLFLSAYIFATVFIHRFSIKLLNYFVNIGIITDIRIIDHDRTVFFRDSMDSIDLSQIQNIEQIKDGLVPAIFKLGDIKIFMTASSATKTFYNVTNAKFHFRCMNRAKEARQIAMRGYSGLQAAQQSEAITTENAHTIQR